MIIKIMSLESGYEELQNIEIIRIKSQKYNILIMQNYAPLIGKIDGNIEFITGDNTKKYENIKGYYLNVNNEFKLFIKE